MSTFRQINYEGTHYSGNPCRNYVS